MTFWKCSICSVSLFTREWIEIADNPLSVMLDVSPSLRGSGLKWKSDGKAVFIEVVALFTREWIEMMSGSGVGVGSGCLPLYEGVD